MIEDTKNRVRVVLLREERGQLEIIWKLGPQGPANGTCQVSMPYVGCDAEEVEGVRALSSEDPTIVVSIVFAVP